MTSLTVDTRELASAVAWAAKTLPARPSIPTLAGILLEADNGLLHLSGFDYDAHSRATIEVGHGLNGRWLVSGRLAEAVTKTLDPKKPTALSVDDGKVLLRNGSTRISLPTMTVEDYPTLPAMPEPVGTVDAKMFADAVGRVTPVTGSYASLPMLTGIHLVGIGSELRLAASDRYRAALATVDWDGNDFEMLVLADQMGKLVGALANGADTITVSWAENLFGLSTATRSTVLRRLALDRDLATYPDIDRMFPALRATTARVDSAGLKAAVERAALVLEPKAAIRLIFAAEGLQVTGAGTGDVADEVGAVVEGDPLDIRCNPAYLLTALQAVGASTVNLWLGAPHRPFSVTSADQDEAYRHIVVPVRSL